MGTTTMIFGPDKLVAGIQYHLLDEGFCLDTDKRAASRQRNRLRKENVESEISRFDWRVMTDIDRLVWLFAHSGLSFRLDESGTAYLIRAKSK